MQGNQLLLRADTRCSEYKAEILLQEKITHSVVLESALINAFCLGVIIILEDLGF